MRGDAEIFVDGQLAVGSIECENGSFDPFCTSQTVKVTLDQSPSVRGMHRLQVQQARGPLSNELPICVGTVNDCR